MNLRFSLLLAVMAACLIAPNAQGAVVTNRISDLPTSTSPSTNTWIEIADMNQVIKSRKYLLTNLATVTQVNAKASVNPTSGYLPYNNAGTFADSPFSLESAKNVLLAFPSGGDSILSFHATNNVGSTLEIGATTNGASYIAGGPFSLSLISGATSWSIANNDLSPNGNAYTIGSNSFPVGAIILGTNVLGSTVGGTYTDNGTTLLRDGVPITGGGSQTPWTSDINAGGYALTNASEIVVTGAGDSDFGGGINVAGTARVNDLVVTNAIPSLNVGTLTFTGGAANVATVFDGNTNLVAASMTTNVLNLLYTQSGNLTNLGKISTNDLVTVPSATTFTNKTFDAAAAGNVLKQTKYMLLMRPDYGDGTKAVPQTNAFNASGLMHYTFAGDGETNTCWVVYETAVPPDIDTSVEMTATIAFVSGGTDTDTVTFHLTYALGAAGTALPTGTGIATSPIVVTTTPSSPASGDVQQSAATTLTGWAASMTAGTPLFIRMARLNDSNDDTQRDLYLRISYASTQ